MIYSVLFKRFSLKSNDERSFKAQKNIIYMFVLKGGNVLIGLLILPLTIGYVDEINYGIWLAISSIVTWMSFFDIGLNNGLRNKYAECMAVDDYKKAQKYVSTTYAMLTLIFFPFLIIFLCINPSVDWNAILNIQINSDIHIIVAILATYFSINFIFSTINIILLADQSPAGASLITFIQQSSILLVLFILMNTTKGSLLNLSLALCLTPLLITFIANFILFVKVEKYRKVRPKLSAIDFSLIKDLFTLGYKFFVIQISALILYQTTNFIIIRYFGAEDVTAYNIMYKYFSIISLFFGIIITPIWSSVTDAMTNSDYEWIKKTVKRYLYVALLFSFFGILLFVFSNYFVKLWIGKSIPHISFSLSLSIFLFIVSSMYSSIFVSVLNGAGVLKMQFLTSVISPFLFLMLNFLFIRYLNLGVASVIFSMLISNFSGLIIAPIQYYKVFYSHAKGIWTA